MPVGPRRPHTIYKRAVTATAFSGQYVCRAIRVCLRERRFDSNFSTSSTRCLRTGKPSRRKSAMSNEYSLKDSVKCLDGVDYEVVKHQAHFEWVVEFEKIIKELSLEVFETLGVNDEKTLKIAVDRFDAHQSKMIKKIDQIKLVADKPEVNDAAKSFAADWAETFKYQATFKYHHLGDGPTAQKMRWAYEASIKYIVICVTHLADMDDSVEFKKGLSEFVKTVVIQDLIDALREVKSELEKLKTSSS